MRTCDKCFISVVGELFTYHLFVEHAEPMPAGAVLPDWHNDQHLFSDFEIVTMSGSEAGDLYGE